MIKFVVISAVILALILLTWSVPKVIHFIKLEMQPINGQVIDKKYYPERVYYVTTYTYIGEDISIPQTTKHVSPEEFWLKIYDEVQNRDRGLPVAKELYERTHIGDHVTNNHVDGVWEY